MKWKLFKSFTRWANPRISVAGVVPRIHTRASPKYTLRHRRRHAESFEDIEYRMLSRIAVRAISQRCGVLKMQPKVVRTIDLDPKDAKFTRLCKIEWQDSGAFMSNDDATVTYPTRRQGSGLGMC